MEQGEALRRITLDIPEHTVPDLMTAIGGFIATHNITVASSDTPPEVAQPGITIESDEQWTPGLVKWVQSAQNTREAVVTSDTFDVYLKSLENYYGEMGRRIINALIRMRYLNQGEVPQESFYLSQTAGYEGIYARFLPSIVDRLASGDLKAANIARRSIALLQGYVKAMTPSTDQQ